MRATAGFFTLHLGMSTVPIGVFGSSHLQARGGIVATEVATIVVVLMTAAASLWRFPTLPPVEPRNG